MRDGGEHLRGTDVQPLHIQTRPSEYRERGSPLDGVVSIIAP